MPSDSSDIIFALFLPLPETRIVAIPLPGRNLFLCTHATDVAWAAEMADGVRESLLAEAATVEEGKATGDGDEDVASAIATLSVKVRVIVCMK